MPTEHTDSMTSVKRCRLPGVSTGDIWLSDMLFFFHSVSPLWEYIQNLMQVHQLAKILDNLLSSAGLSVIYQKSYICIFSLWYHQNSNRLIFNISKILSYYGAKAWKCMHQHKILRLPTLYFVRNKEHCCVTPIILWGFQVIESALKKYNNRN